MRTLGYRYAELSNSGGECWTDQVGRSAHVGIAEASPYHLDAKRQTRGADSLDRPSRLSASNDVVSTENTGTA